MASKPTPLDRLNARLSGLAGGQGATTPPPTTPDGLAFKYIAIADRMFADPIATITMPWRRQEHLYTFSRSVHDFSDYEAFIVKFAVVLAGIGRLDQDNADLLAAVATYAGGKAQVRRGGPRPNYVPSGYDELETRGANNQLPGSLDHYACEINTLLDEQRRGPSQALRTWIARHVGASPNDSMISTSLLFTEDAGPYTLPLGLLPNGRTLFYKGEASLLTVAPPGKGKTQCHVLPTLASYRGPAIVLDIKGECYDRTAAWRQANVGPVLRFNPVAPETSSRYNPLAFVSDDPDELWESSRFLAEWLVVVRNANESTWESQGKDLLTLIIAFVVALNEPAERTMVQVLDLVATIGLTDMLGAVADKEGDLPGAMRRVAARFLQMSTAAPKQFEGVLSGASQHLQVWEGPKTERVTKASDWSPSDFRNTPCPTLYLCIPPDAIETYAPVLRVIIGQHVRLLMRSHQGGHAPILFLLDELPRLGRMEPIREALEVGRSYGIKLWMIAQYPEQLTQAYAGVGEGMMDVCDVRMYMNPTAATAEKLAKMFAGGKPVVRGGKPPLEAADILGPAYRDSVFVLASNETPQILAKQFFWQH